MGVTRWGWFVTTGMRDLEGLLPRKVRDAVGHLVSLVYFIFLFFFPQPAEYGAEEFSL